MLTYIMIHESGTLVGRRCRIYYVGFKLKPLFGFQFRNLFFWIPIQKQCWINICWIRTQLVVVVVVVVVVVPNGHLGGLWTKCMFFKKVFSPRPEATVQVNFNAKAHLLNMKCKKNKKNSPRRDAPFRVYCYIIQTTKQKKALA